MKRENTSEPAERVKERKIGRRKFLKLAGATAGLTILNAACGPAPAPTPPATATPVPAAPAATATPVPPKPTATPLKPVTIEWWAFEHPLLEAFHQEFTKQNPLIQIKLSGSDWYAENQKFLAATAAGGGPDVIPQRVWTFYQYASRGMYLPLDEFFNRDGLKQEDWFPGLLDDLTWQGQLYGLTNEGGVLGVWSLFWNKDVFQEAGLDPEAPPKTWAEMESYAARLVKKDAQGNYERLAYVPTLVLGLTDTIYLNGLMNGGSLISPDGKTVTPDDPKIVKVMEWIVEFTDTYCGGFQNVTDLTQLWGGGVQGWGLQLQGMKEGRIAAHPDHTGTHWWFVKEQVPVGVNHLPLPPGGRKLAYHGGGCNVIGKNSKNPEAAWEFVKWSATTPGLLAWFEIMFKAQKEAAEKEGKALEWLPVGLSPYKPAQQVLDEAASSDKWTDEVRQVRRFIAEMWSDPQGIAPQQIGLATQQYRDELGKALERALAHQQTPKEALLQAKSTVQRLLDEAWASVKQ